MYPGQRSSAPCQAPLVVLQLGRGQGLDDSVSGAPQQPRDKDQNQAGQTKVHDVIASRAFTWYWLKLTFIINTNPYNEFFNNQGFISLAQLVYLCISLTLKFTMYIRSNF